MRFVFFVDVCLCEEKGVRFYFFNVEVGVLFLFLTKL